MDTTKLPKELTDAAEMHQREIAELIQEHQKELAETVALYMQERAHRERLENELASQRELVLCESLGKQLLNGAQPEHQRQEVNALFYLLHCLVLISKGSLV